MRRLKTISISGYKSFGAEQTIAFSDVTVCLGANGAGKSNLVSLFKMLNEMATGGLENFIAKSGYANSILHFGASKTKAVNVAVVLTEEDQQHDFKVKLSFGMPDTIYVNSESDRMSDAVKEFLSDCCVFQFHDTSASSRLRNSCYIENADYLMSDAGNLAAFLYGMKINHPKYYKRIVNHVRMMVPQFRDFSLKPSVVNQNNIFLNWIGEQGDDYLFGPHQLSDGSLRFMALATLLLQPEETLPAVIVLDEPELGLHPAAITSLAGMISVAKRNCQIILATQSPEFVDHFDLDEILVVDYDKKNKQSELKRLDQDRLKGWLEEYSIAELWDKNVLGGRPG